MHYYSLLTDTGKNEGCTYKVCWNSSCTGQQVGKGKMSSRICLIYESYYKFMK